MKVKALILYIALLTFSIALPACQGLLGTKEDDTVKEIFEEGAIDPTLNPQSIGYVPVLPVWEGFDAPMDIYAGYDEMVYVVDKQGVHVLDQTGTRHRSIQIPGAMEVVQDRRLHTYVIGKAPQTVNGEVRLFSAIYRLSNTAGAGDVAFLDTLIHPYADVSRRNTSIRKEDEEVEFTGVAPMSDNTIYVSRSGPRNDVNAAYRPDNAVLIFDREGVNTSYARGLSPVVSSIKSAINISAIATEVAPPQELYGMSELLNFVICQKPGNGYQPEYGALYITVNFNPESGYTYDATPGLTEFDRDKSSRFLYQTWRFPSPEDVCIAPDRRHIFIVDSELDSLFQFSITGEEGIVPPASFKDRRNAIVSFGGDGDGPFQFRNPSGVCYLRKVLFVADKGNGRILRYKLNTDLE
ncbi:MAG: hypothetical protein HYZ16_08790 [Bacteroidetes bacterium]|jgi:hypothetical protein|nr:hypothetical protein [Bacteroidota bacterium]